MRHVHTFMDSPLGRLKLVGSERGVLAVLWPEERPGRVPLGVTDAAPNHPLLIETERQLRAYFDGSRSTFDLPLDPVGTNFQRTVWTQLAAIPFGETRTYAQLAAQIGKPAASRAVGAAIGRNPLSILVPCHRVVGSSGALTGFAGGVPAKEFLLKLERAAASTQMPLSTA